MRQLQLQRRCLREIVARELKDLVNQDRIQNFFWESPNKKLKIALENFLDRAKQNTCSHPSEHLHVPRPFMVFCFVHLVSVLECFYVTILVVRSMHLVRNFSHLQNMHPSHTLSSVYRWTHWRRRVSRETLQPKRGSDCQIWQLWNVCGDTTHIQIVAGQNRW